jgi:hypothetical protein
MCNFDFTCAVTSFRGSFCSMLAYSAVAIIRMNESDQPTRKRTLVQDVTCYLMCSMFVHYIIQKTLNTNKCTKSLFSSIITHSYMFRPCCVIFREKPSVVVTLCCSIQFSKNVLLTVHCAIYGGVNSFVVSACVAH